MYLFRPFPHLPANAGNRHDMLYHATRCTSVLLSCSLCRSCPPLPLPVSAGISSTPRRPVLCIQGAAQQMVFHLRTPAHRLLTGPERGAAGVVSMTMGGNESGRGCKHTMSWLKFDHVTVGNSYAGISSWFHAGAARRAAVCCMHSDLQLQVSMRRFLAGECDGRH